jgi:hypothetical protein
MLAIYNRLLLHTEVYSPVSTLESLTNKEKYKKQVERLRDKLKFSIDKLKPLFEYNCTKDKAMRAWNWVFNHPFWADAVEDEPETDDFSALNEQALVLSYPVKPALGKASHQQVMRWPFFKECRVRLDAYIYLGKKVKLGGLNSDGRPIKSNLNARRPYQIFWQVVNTGRHAESVGGGRGNVFESSDPNPLVHWEDSLYTGKHWIECFIVKNCICVARSGRFYVNIYNSEFPIYS